MPAEAERVDLRVYAWLSVAAAVVTITLKTGAYLLTGSVGLLSDAAESLVNLVAAVVAVVVLTIAGRPADDSHHFGHSKAEYFSAAVEGSMIFVAAVVILVSAIARFLAPQPLENVGIGLVISVVASAVNGVVAVVLMRAGRRHRSITLVADGKHLFTDVVTSAGVVLGVVLVALTGFLRLDPIIAFAVGCNIVWTGYRLLAEAVGGLMDPSVDDETHRALNAELDAMSSEQVRFHALRTREAGRERFASVHVLVPGAWTVRRAHDLAEEVESRLHAVLGEGQVFTHIEPAEDPRAYEPAEQLGARPWRLDELPEPADVVLGEGVADERDDIQHRVRHDERSDPPPP